jgi:hypothetical protein
MKMNQDYIKPDWSIIEEGFDASKSLSFSGDGNLYVLILKLFRLSVILQEYTIQIKLKWDGGKMAISILPKF